MHIYRPDKLLECLPVGSKLRRTEAGPRVVNTSANGHTTTDNARSPAACL
jgi:hypothetical protein